MIKKDKKVKKKEKILEVIEAFQQDVGYDRVRIDHQTRTELDLNVGDTIELGGARKTLAIVWRAHPSDEGKKTIHIDRHTRKKVGVDIGQKITIRKTKEKLSTNEQMKRHVLSSHDDEIVVAKVDTKLMKEIKEIWTAHDHKTERIDALIKTMGRLEGEARTIHKTLWEILHKNLKLKDDESYSYNRQTGEVTIVEDR